MNKQEMCKKCCAELTSSDIRYNEKNDMFDYNVCKDCTLGSVRALDNIRGMSK